MAKVGEQNMNQGASLRDPEDWGTIPSDLKRIATLTAVIEGVVAAYKRANPMRTADCHNPGCPCLRCAVDRAESVI